MIQGNSTRRHGTWKIFAAALLLVSLLSCESNSTNSSGNLNPDPSPPDLTTQRILPLGASRVEGARPEYESFRYELWKDLIDQDRSFDLIGTRQDDATYPTYEEQEFDRDHEGWGGWTSEDIRESLAGWLEQTGPPDIVLFSSPGGNDALIGLPYDDAIENVSAIVDLLQDDNPNVTILIEQMAPAHSDVMTEELANYMEQFRGDVITLADQKTTEASRIIVVDMATGFTDDYLADDVHYNEAGADFVASRYAEVLLDLLDME